MWKGFPMKAANRSNWKTFYRYGMIFQIVVPVLVSGMLLIRYGGMAAGSVKSVHAADRLVYADKPQQDHSLNLQVVGSISGTVTDAETGLPVADMEIQLSGADNYPLICTDINGQYQLTGLPLQTELRVSSGGQNSGCAGADNYIQSYWENTPDSEDAILITLTEADPDLTGIDFALRKGGSISGTVTAAEIGLPLPDMHIQLSGDNVHRGACTDENGHYRLTELPGGIEYRVSSGGDNGSCGEAIHYIPVYWRDTFLYGDATLITLTESAADVTDINFVLQTGGSISGIVTDASTGLPVPDMQVYVVSEDFYQRVCTDVNGQYRLTDVPRNMELRAASGGENTACEGAGDYTQRYWNNAPGWSQATLITLTEASLDLIGINFALQTGGSIAGTVTDSQTGMPLPNMKVQVSGEDIDLQVCTGANGEYLFSGLALDIAFQIISGGDSSACGGVPGYAQSHWESLDAGNETNQIMLTGEMKAVTGINIALQIGGTVSGTVTDLKTGQLLANIPVVLSSDNIVERACTDVNGQYLVEGLPLDVAFRAGSAGENTDCGGTAYIQAYWQNTAEADFATLITLTREAPIVTGIDFALRTGGSIAGIVTDAETGLPVSGIHVQLSGENVFQGVCTDANGQYQFTRLPYNIEFVIGGGSENSVCEGAANYRQSYWQNTSEWDFATPIILTETAPEVSGIDLAVKSGGSISGTVTDAATGEPLANVQVVIAGGNLFPRTCTDVNGQYHVNGLPQGIGFLVSSGGDNGVCGEVAGYVQVYWHETFLQDQATLITLSDAAPDMSGIDLELQSGGSIVGTGTDGVTGLRLGNIHV